MKQRTTKLLSLLLALCMVLTLLPAEVLATEFGEFAKEQKDSTLEPDGSAKYLIRDDVIWHEAESERIYVKDFFEETNGESVVPFSSYSGATQLASYFPVTGSIDTFYGRQLNNPERYLYRQIENFYIGAISRRGAASYVDYYITDSVEPFYGLTGDQLDNLYAPYQAEMHVYWSTAVMAFLMDHPQYPCTNLYLGSSPCFWWYEDEDDGLLYGDISLRIEFGYNGSSEDIFDWYLAYKNLENSLNFEGSNYEKVLAIHDYICRAVTYSLSSSDPYSVYGALIEHRAVCQGYALAFKALCDSVGIPCHTIAGWGNGGTHMWNAVQMEDGKWYAVDTTWDDQDDVIYYDFCLSGSATIPKYFYGIPFSESHIVDMTYYANGYSDSLVPPVLNPNAYTPQTTKITVWEDEDCTSEINSMYTTYGSFSWGDMDKVPIDVVSYDSAYIRIEYPALSFGEKLEGTITAPKGFSFSADKMESNWEFSVSAEDQQPSVKIYPIYEENYQDNDILTFEASIAKTAPDGTVTIETTYIDTIPVYKNPNSGEILYRNSFEDSGETLMGPMNMGDLDFSIFRVNSSTAPYNQDLSLLSAAFCMASYKEEGIKKTFRNFGFSNIETFKYKPNNDQITLDKNIVASAFATKKYIIDDDIYTIIVIAVRGTLGEEWYSNFDIGSGDTIHNGFNNGKIEVLNEFDVYRDNLKRNNIETGNVKILVTGHSRGAAVADLVTLELNSSPHYAEYAYNDIFAYTFATPHSVPTSMQCENVSNIYNIVNEQDLVTHVPGKFYSPGYNLYIGYWLYIMNSEDFKKEFEKFERLALAQKTKEPFYKQWVFPAWLYLLDFVPMDFTTNLKSMLADLMLKRKLSSESLIELILPIFKLTDGDPILTGRIVKVVSALAEAKDDQPNWQKYLEDRIWANHPMETYMCWVNLISDDSGFSEISLNDSSYQDESSAPVLKGGVTITEIRCPVDVYVYDENQLVTSIENNTVTQDDGPFCVVNGDEKIFYMGNDDSYTFEIVGYDEGQMDIEVTEFGEDGQQTKFILYDDLPVEPQVQVVLTAENCSTEYSRYSLVTDEGDQIAPDYSASGDQIGTLELSITTEGSGYAIGAGRYTPGETAVLYALADENIFEGWYQDGKLISSEEMYEFTILENIELMAKFTDQAAEHTHSWAKDWTNNETHHWHECTTHGCDVKSDSDKDDYMTHTSDDGKVTSVATAYQDGVRTYSCIICGYVIRTESIPATGSSSGGGFSSGGGSGSGSSSSYQITTSATSNGAVTVTPTSAKSGDKVTITVTPNNGYTTYSVTVTDSSGKSVSVTDSGNGIYTFTMPSGKVIVDAIFVPIRKEASEESSEEPMERAWVNPFTDMSESDWFYNEVAYVVQNGLMNGVGNRQFNPSGTTTRGMIMTILARQGGLDTSGSSPWYQMGMEWALREGVSDGTGPEANITREQLATMLWRYAGRPAVTGNLDGYSDASNVHDWASVAMIWAVQNGIINGYDGKLNPQGNALRSEAAAMITRYCRNIKK